jgi:hypothetical protein
VILVMFAVVTFNVYSYGFTRGCLWVEPSRKNDLDRSCSYEIASATAWYGLNEVGTVAPI